MLTKKRLLTEYTVKKRTIKNRLKEFTEDKDRFLELCFCICTPQSKAIKVAEVITVLNRHKLKNYNHEKLAGLLKKNTRFHKNKARYIIHARNYENNINNLPKDGMIAREFLVKNIKGLGYKEASHFLRNIGYRDICIIDRHVINLMTELGVLKKAQFPKNAKEYLKMERTIKRFAKEINIDVDELDLLLWSIKTGMVFK